jgi:hypothetical protein
MRTIDSFSFEKPFAPIGIDGCTAEYLNGSGKNKGRKPQERYASFDYCYNHFQSFRERGSVCSLAAPEHLAESCLHVAWYLASWGMLRNSPLLGKSMRFCEPLITGIASFDPTIWEIDVDRYNEQTIAVLLQCKEMIGEKLCDGKRAATDTLVTKVMLGVFGNVPAFDRYFRQAIGVNAMTKSSLERVREFYGRKRPVIDAHRIPTLDLVTGAETDRLYTKAKIIDMIGFIAGQRLE